MPWISGPEGGREWESERESKGSDQGWLNAGDELFDSMLDTIYEDYDREIAGNEQAVADALYAGWFGEVDRFTMAEARFDFFELTGMDFEDFPWEDWRDWYES